MAGKNEAAAKAPPVPPRVGLAAKKPPDPPSACLVVIRGRDLGRRYVIEPRTMTIGRDESSDIQLVDDGVSRRHAEVALVERRVKVWDVGSTSGTHVDDRRIEEAELRHGDRLGVGRVIFKCLVGPGIEQAYHEEIYRLSTTDTLTGAYNKRFFVDLLRREAARARREEQALAVAVFDIDHFRETNDRWGHVSGDDVLRQLAGLAKEWAREEDVVARWGGGEFAVVLPGLDLHGATIRADELRRRFEDTPLVQGETTVGLTLSAGVAALELSMKELGETDAADEANDLIERALGGLAEAKKRGRNCVAHQDDRATR